MASPDWLTEGFETNRGRLRAVAYRMLGSLAEADDAVQEAWLRVAKADASEVDNLSAWLTTIVARVCLNALRSRNARREEPLDTHVPDPVITRRRDRTRRIRRAGRTPRSRRCWPTRSGSRCRWCWKR